MSTTVISIPSALKEMARATSNGDTVRLEEIGYIIEDWICEAELKDSVAMLIEAIQNLIENSGDEEQ